MRSITFQKTGLHFYPRDRDRDRDERDKKVKKEKRSRSRSRLNACIAEFFKKSGAHGQRFFFFESLFNSIVSELLC